MNSKDRRWLARELIWLARLITGTAILGIFLMAGASHIPFLDRLGGVVAEHQRLYWSIVVILLIIGSAATIRVMHRSRQDRGRS